jgi:hypothetical protein
MQNASDGDASVQPEARNDGYRSIVSDLISLIEHVQASTQLIESAIAREASLGNHEVAANVIVLDDVTPRYAKANAALSACSARLGIALHFLLESRTSKHGADETAESDRRPLRLIGHA